MNDYLIILDAGHGGLINGDYVTPGKRAVHDDIRINEGVLNRAVVNLLAFQLDKIGIRNHIVSDSNNDVPLRDRVSRANKLSRGKKSLFISIHHNASKTGDAYGTEIYNYFGESPSDTFAKIFEDEFIKDKPPFVKYRGIKEENFQVLRETMCPALLIEFGFMDNQEDAKYISSYDGIINQVKWLVESISIIVNSK